MIRYLDRKHTDCSKWDNLGAMFGREDLQAMWVADMDFRCPDCVIEAIRQYTDFGVFGYYKPRPMFRPFWTGRKRTTAIVCSGTGFGLLPASSRRSTGCSRF